MAHLGMVGARFSGLDGVTLESVKVAAALERQGHSVAWFAGDLDPSLRPGQLCSDASFESPQNLEIQALAFGSGNPRDVQRMIDDGAEVIARSLERFIAREHLEGLIIQNAWAIPMQLPLAVAIAMVVRDSGIRAVGHHHDFAWERPRFAECVVPDTLATHFPPSGPSISHVVINSLAKDALMARRGIASSVLPNVMDFESGRPESDGGAAFRALAGVEHGETVLLQPTRVIRRKGIERTIDLAHRIEGEPVVVVTHPDDLDLVYWEELQDRADALDVDLRLVDAGRSAEALGSAYAAADIVSFPSTYEGYGNALVEAVYYRSPVVVNRYPVYVRDIAPIGLSFVEFDGVITGATVAEVEQVLRSPTAVDEMVESNFETAARSLSYRRVADVFSMFDAAG